MKNSQHIGFWILIALLGFLLGPIMRSGPSMEEFVRQEISQTRIALGDTVTNSVVDFALGVFQGSPLGMVSQLATNSQQTREEQRLSKTIGGPVGHVMSSLFNSYLQGLALLAFVVAMRFAIAMVWLLILFPVLAASIHDGFMQRRIKRAEFGAIRPATFTLAGVFVIPMLALPLIYLVVPFSISPLLAPVWAFVIAVPLAILVSNMQPLFGR